jgi:2-dehydro-3-deoxyphosphooctonate aldolase (KDO 8-P synthase)
MNETPAALFRRLKGAKHFFLIAGPCVIEDEAGCLEIGRHMKKICARLDIPYVFKASFDKANRSSSQSYRGPGFEQGLEILSKIGQDLKLPVLSDIHTEQQALAAGKVLDILQIPAFLCRQTDLLQAAASTKRIINIKKGQFLSPNDMRNVVDKMKQFGNQKLLLTERGSSFGYNNLVTDMRSIPIMQGFGCPVVFDATHSVQLPGGQGDKSGGQGEFAPVLARAAMAVGAEGLFVETHPDPTKSPSDGPNMIPLPEMNALLKRLSKIKAALK